jgi:hypothetical protein
MLLAFFFDRSSADLEFRQIGDIYSYSFSGTVRSLISEDEDSNSSLDEVSWLGQDWALIRILNPEFRLPNRFYALPSSSPIFINGHLKNGELKAGKVSVLSVTGVVHGILNGSQTSMMMGQSYFTVRSIALERQLGERPYIPLFAVVNLIISSGG